ncbi:MULTISPECIES: PAS domain-containing hybrid sensor histidine kinase/response regulator [Neptunomonas]|uniref:PAS domain-containing hybrid sensor histidine kinase/response regulator n=2 Tax=Neptunomonas TaxID=75687 RepID=UPI0035132BC1
MSKWSMKKRYDEHKPATVEELMGLGNHSARKNYYSELSQKLDELEAERNRYKWIFDNALHGIFQADMKGRIRIANPAMARICGYASDSELTQRVEFLGNDLFFQSLDFHILLERLKRDGKVFRYETRLVRADGETIYVSMNVLLKEEVSDTTFEAFVQDITERVNDQMRLRKLNEELEARVLARTEALESVNAQLRDEIVERSLVQHALQEAKEQAVAANQSKDKYLAAASHDLLQPMNAARLLVSTLRERPLSMDDHHLVERIHVALDSAEELLTDLLDISKLDQNAVQADCCDFHIAQLFNTLSTEFQAVAEQSNLQLRVKDSDVMVYSDARLLMRILRNFVSNALRYTDTGGVLVAARKRSGELSIEVWDTGDGIPSGAMSDIFREFNQLSQHRNGERKGVGLGLAIVERISRVLNHKVSVQSVPGRGSVFRVSVPLSDAKPAAMKARPAPVAAGHFSGEAVLVVDNEPEILMSMAALLTQWGLTAYTAESAQAAIELLDDEGVVPRATLLDFHLNDNATALDALADLDESFGRLPTALITAERHDPDLKILRSGGVQVLNKPVKPGKLRALLAHMLTVSTAG